MRAVGIFGAAKISPLAPPLIRPAVHINGAAKVRALDFLSLWLCLTILNLISNKLTRSQKSSPDRINGELPI